MRRLKRRLSVDRLRSRQEAIRPQLGMIPHQRIIPWFERVDSASDPVD